METDDFLPPWVIFQHSLGLYKPTSVLLLQYLSKCIGDVCHEVVTLVGLYASAPLRNINPGLWLCVGVKYICVSYTYKIQSGSGHTELKQWKVRDG